MTTRRICVDPGTTTHGLVVTEGRHVVASDSAANSATVEEWIRLSAPCLVLVERIQAHGIAGNDVIRTAEWSAHFRAIALEHGRDCAWLYRRHVKRALDVSGRSSDAVIRARLRSEYGEPAWQTAKLCPRRKAKSHTVDCPACGGSGFSRRAGWLAQVKGHAVQALALSLAYDLGAREVTP